MTTHDFALNGRFVGQPQTGVQRYARSVAGAMDRRLGAAGDRAVILAPVGTPDPHLGAMPLREIGPGDGQAWEQGTLPARWGGRLLNLGNTAPAGKRDQVVCIHDANVFEMPDSYGRAFRTLYRTLQPAIARRAARIATVSGDSARQIARHLPVLARDVAVLPNGHEHALAWDPGRAWKASVGLADFRRGGTRPFVLAIGSRARHKNLALMAILAPRLAERGIDVVVAGGRGAVFNAVETAGAPSLFELGDVTDDDLAYLLDEALCLAFPSWTEGFGLPIVEAMARGCPVVSSNRASMPEVCGDAAILASPDDPEAWLAAIARLAGSEDLRRDFAGRGRERVGRFSWDTTAAGYLDLMHEPSTRLGTQRATSPLPTVGVAMATMGRPEVASQTIRRILGRQTLQPVALSVCTVNEGDEGDVAGLPGVTVLRAPSGLSRQRNAALEDVMGKADVVVFFDDDFVPDDGWLEAAARTFRDEASLVALTGRVIADDVKGIGIPFEEAIRMIEGDHPAPVHSWEEPFSPYGCNMAFRTSAIGDVRFDVRLPLYSWLEDRDFGATLARNGGRTARSSAMRGVHMGVKKGRGRGDSLGYSQIANPVYMLSKGTMTRSQVAAQLFRNVASNAIGSLRSEPWIDRRGRLKGNALGFLDVLRGRREPERAAAIAAKRKGG